VTHLLSSYLRPSNDDSLLYLKIIPHSKENEIVGIVGDRLKLKIAAAPEKNKANKELCKFLDSLLDLESSRLNVIKGHTSCMKTVLIKNCHAKNIELIIETKLLVNQPTLF
jgi:uncharacterized protein